MGSTSWGLSCIKWLRRRWSAIIPNAQPLRLIIQQFASSTKRVSQDIDVVNASDRSDELARATSKRPKRHRPETSELQTLAPLRSLSFKSRRSDSGGGGGGRSKLFDISAHVHEHEASPAKALPEPDVGSSPRPPSDKRDAAAVKLQKVYKSYRTRRNLADCAIVIEELWWRVCDFAELERSSISYYDNKKPETAVSRWTRALKRAAKVGKGLCKDEKAQKLALRHWLEAIDPCHRYGHNLHLYYSVWFASESSQPFFYWLDIGDGKEVNLDSCPRTALKHQRINYLGPQERKAYEVIIVEGKLVYKQTRRPVNTMEGSKWIFVLSTLRNFYIGQKRKGQFQHSSFLAGGAATAAGRLVAHEGVLKAIWPYSGHYHPTEENFKEFIGFLEEQNVDLTNVKRCAADDEVPPTLSDVTLLESTDDSLNKSTDNSSMLDECDDALEREKVTMLRKWSTGAGPRIGCVREYPSSLQFRALEQVKLSPRSVNSSSPFPSSGPIPSPRPSPRIHLSPSIAYMGLPS